MFSLALNYSKYLCKLHDIISLNLDYKTENSLFLLYVCALFASEFSMFAVCKIHSYEYDIAACYRELANASDVAIVIEYGFVATVHT